MERKLRLPALVAALTIAGTAAGCSSMPAWMPAWVPIPVPTRAAFRTAPAARPTAASAPEPEPPSTSADEPRVLTDLSSLSPVNPLEPFGPQNVAASKARAAASAPVNSATVKSAESVGAVRQVGDDQHPGEERFLNDKAAQFDTLSVRLMDQLFAATEELESTDEVARLRVPTDTKLVVITGTLNKEGKLLKLVLDRRSGQAAVDKMMLQACKRALYINNPPAEAMTPGGDYRVRIEARIENFASMDQQHWIFKTYLGIALL